MGSIKQSILKKAFEGKNEITVYQAADGNN
jgi:hypothetical protein